MSVPHSQGQSEQSLSLDNSFQWDVGFNMCKELPCLWDSENRLVGDWVDYQLDNLGGMDQMNGNFMYERNFMDLKLFWKFIILSVICHFHFDYACRGYEMYLIILSSSFLCRNSFL